MDDCFFWYRLTRVVPSKGPLNGSVMCVHVCIFFSFVTVRDRVRALLTCCTALKSTACSNKTIPLNLRQFLSHISVSISQVIGCEDRLRNDQYCVEWGVKLYCNQLLSRMHSRKLGIWPKIKRLLLLEHAVHL